MILSKIIAKPFITDNEDVLSISIPQKYIGQIIKTPTQSYKIVSIDNDGNATFAKIIDKIDLDNINNDLNTKITNEINRAVGVEGNLSNIDSSLNNTNLVGAINSSYSKAKEYADAIKDAILDGVDVDLDTLNEITNSIDDITNFKGYVDNNINDLDNRKIQYLEERDSDDNITKQQIVDKDGNTLIDILNIKNDVNINENDINELKINLSNEIDRAISKENELVETDIEIKKMAILNIVNINDDYSANVDELILVDTSDKEITINLPSANNYDKIEIKDITGNAHTNNIIISNVNGENLNIDIDSYKIKLIYKDEWIIL